MKRGDVVLMVIPGELGKPRAGIIVQADELGNSTTSVIVCPMSSDVRDNIRLRPVIEPSAGTGLRIRSQLMTDKIVALRRTRLKRVLGSLDPEARDHLDRALLVVLGLAR